MSDWIPSRPQPPDTLEDVCRKAFHRLVRTVREITATLPAGDGVIVSFGLDGFTVDQIGLDGPLLILEGLSGDGHQGTRVIHPHQLDVQIVVIPAEEKNPRARREIGFHTREEIP